MRKNLTMAVDLRERDDGQRSWPIMLRWGDTAAPLPVRIIETRGGRCDYGLEAPPWLTTGPANRPFDFCGHMERLCADIVLRCSSLGHIDLGRVLVTVTQARSSCKHGLQARVTPMRFHGGAQIRNRKNSAYRIQRFVIDDREMLYLIAFCLPRFLDLEFDDKMVTLFHELYHIGPEFDGDLRRHGGRCAIHTHSQRRYDQHMAALAREYLAQRPDPSLHAFLRLNFAQLQRRHGTIFGTVVPRPKLIPVDRDESLAVAGE